jgi:hypothetical protein
MSAKATTATSGHLDVGDTWLLGLEVRKDTKAKPLVDADVTVTITRPDTTTAAAAVSHEGTGCYLASHVLMQTGRYTALAVVSGTVVAVVTYEVDALVPGLPTVFDVQEYLGEGAPDLTVITSALNAEVAAQAKVCRVDGVYPADLAEALKRRVARNIAMRGIPTGLQTSATEAGSMTVRIGWDSEIRRFEAPYRKIVVA